MHKAKKILLGFVGLTIVQFCFNNLFAQGITAAIDSTPSICYNDGTLTVTASGGTAPYSYNITSGPSNPNVTYPIVLLPGDNTFGGLPYGSFTIVVTDAVGDTGTFTGTVAGNYQFPSLAFSTSIPGSIIATESGGLAPYQYAISSTSSNAGFGAYQTSGTFSQLCPGTYWIRVRDSCGNIYTDEVIFSETITNTINCINFSKGNLNVTAAGGTAPYTYSIDGMSNTTGNFTGLPSYFSDSLVITDACGVKYSVFLSPPVFNLMELCPSDGSIFCTNINYPISPTTFTFECLNCTPVQSVTVPYTSGMNVDTLFRNQSPGLNYDIVILSSACGGDTVEHTPVSITSDIQMSTSYISCRSFQATVSAGAGTVAVDSFVLSYQPYGPGIQSNTTGLFYQLPDSVYYVTAYIGALCGDTPFAVVTIPYFGAGCFTLMRDSICQNTWEYSANSFAPELYSLLTAPGDTVPAIPNPQDNANFYNLTSGHTYTMISDSGCAEQIKAPHAVSPAPAVVAFLPCVGQPVIKFTSPDYTYCDGGTVASASQIRIKVYYLDSLIFDGYESTAGPILVNITDSGWYQYMIYAANTADTSYLLRYDTICPIDTGQVYMNNTQVPYLFSSVGLVCDSNSNDTAFYMVYGGSAPYTVQIPGYDTVTLQTNTGIFPTHHPGSYTMLVYDNCGISRSLTFDIVDTCSGCPYGTIYLPYAFSCAGDTIPLISQSIHAQTYQWYVNGILYSTAKDTSFVSGAGGNSIMLIVISSTGCADTATIHTTDTCHGCPYVAMDLPDTLYCVGNTVQLMSTSIGGIAFQWLINGQLYSIAADTIFTAIEGRLQVELRVTSATGCTDSVFTYINVEAPYTINLGPDTAYCGGFVRVLSTGIATTHWSTGAIAAKITVDTAGQYTATAGNICGTTSAAITLSEKPIPLVDLGDDTSLCMSGEVILNAGFTGIASYEWQDNSTAETLTVSETGTYSVSVTVNGCTGSDSVNVLIIHAPQPFSVGNDTTLCKGASLLLEAYQQYSYYMWNTGSTQPFIYVAESGRYIVTDSNKCGSASDSISVTVDDCTCRVQIPTAFSPNGDGKNDKYGGIAHCVPLNYLLEIYNRWGQKLFTSYSIDNKWDGSYDNHEQPLGVYVYVMKYTDPYTNIEYTQTGNVTLVR